MSDEVKNLYVALRVHVESRKSIPGSWDDIHEAGFLTNSSLPQIVRELGDFEAKYRFLNETDRVALPRDGRRIVAMSVEPGKDEYFARKDNSDTRIIFFVGDDLTVSAEVIQEDALAAIFRENGKDLMQYTGADGHWGPLHRISEAAFRLEEGRPDRVSRQGVEGSMVHPKNGESNNESESAMTIQWLALIAVGFVLGTWILWIRMRIRTRCVR